MSVKGDLYDISRHRRAEIGDLKMFDPTLAHRLEHRRQNDERRAAFCRHERHAGQQTTGRSCALGACVARNR